MLHIETWRSNMEDLPSAAVQQQDMLCVARGQTPLLRKDACDTRAHAGHACGMLPLTAQARSVGHRQWQCPRCPATCGGLGHSPRRGHGASACALGLTEPWVAQSCERLCHDLHLQPYPRALCRPGWLCPPPTWQLPSTHRWPSTHKCLSGCENVSGGPPPPWWTSGRRCHCCILRHGAATWRICQVQLCSSRTCYVSQGGRRPSCEKMPATPGRMQGMHVGCSPLRLKQGQ